MLARMFRDTLEHYDHVGVRVADTEPQPRLKILHKIATAKSKTTD